MLDYRIAKWSVLIALFFAPDGRGSPEPAYAASGSETRAHQEKAAAVLERKKDKATLVLSAPKIESGTLHVRLSDEIKVVFLVEDATPLEVKIPGDLPGGVWRSEPVGTATTIKLENGRYRWRYAFVVEPSRPDKQMLALPDLQYRAKGEDWRTVSWPPVPVVVTTSIRDVDVSQIKAPPNIEELPRVAATRSWIWWTAGGVAALAVIAIAALLLRRARRRHPSPPAPPEQIALREIQRLETTLADNSIDSVSFSSQLAEVIRAYLERKYLIPASRRTAAEFLELLAEVEEVADEHQEIAAEFFHRVQLGKFAPAEVKPAVLRETIRQARMITGNANASPSSIVR